LILLTTIILYYTVRQRLLNFKEVTKSMPKTVAWLEETFFFLDWSLSWKIDMNLKTMLTNTVRYRGSPAAFTNSHPRITV
jgi:hypothetical protein